MKDSWGCPLCDYIADYVLLLGAPKEGFIINGDIANHLTNEHSVRDVPKWVKEYLNGEHGYAKQNQKEAKWNSS